MTPYQGRLDRLREHMRRDGIDIVFLNYGADFTWLTGITAPIYYDILKSGGDWVTGLLIGVDHHPVVMLHEYFAFNLPGDLWISDIRIYRSDGDPDAFVAQTLGEFDPGGKTIAVDKMAWAQSLLGLQNAAPTSRFVALTDDYTDVIRNEIVTEDGFGEYYMYLGLGHSIGCDVHESPWLRPGFDDPIRSGMCFTLEPKIWKPGVFYVRCEDVVVVGQDHARSLTAYPYDPIIVAA